MGQMLCNHCDGWVSTANDAPRCSCCGERCCSRCLGKEKYHEGRPTMAFSEICNGHKECPFCKATKPIDNEAGNECCEAAEEVGFWGDGLWWHTNDDCAKPA
jgi:hypothetical protein